MGEPEAARHLRRERTFLTSTERVDFRVLSYYCRDVSRLTFLGKHQKESLWKVEIGDDIVEVKLRVDRSVARNHMVGVEFNGKRVFPCTERGLPVQGKTMDILKSDFVWRHAVKGKPPGMGKAKFFEVKQLGQCHGAPAGTWLPATVTEQLPHGLYTANVFSKDHDGKERSVCFQRVPAKDIREHATKMALQVPQRTLVMEIPAGDPLQQATLSVAGPDSKDKGELITYFFARRSPRPGQSLSPGHLDPSKLVLDVSQDRSQVYSDASVDDLHHFLRGDVQGVHAKEQSNPLQHEWCFMASPFAKHLVQLKACSKSQNVFILTVDDEVMVESAPEDFDCRGDFWQCSFKLEGERVLVWKLFEVTKSGRPLNTRAQVHQKKAFSHEVIVRVNWKDPKQAALSVDGVDFHSLPSYDTHKRVPMNSTPEALCGNFDLHAPTKEVDPTEKDSKTEGLQETINRFFSELSRALQFQSCGCSRPGSATDDAQLAKPASVPMALAN